jgi:hypothetical protein
MKLWRSNFVSGRSLLLQTLLIKMLLEMLYDSVMGAVLQPAAST